MYCPLKRIASAIATLGTNAQSRPFPIEGAYLGEEECDREACGWYVRSIETCGIAQGKGGAE